MHEALAQASLSAPHKNQTCYILFMGLIIALLLSCDCCFSISVGVCVGVRVIYLDCRAGFFPELLI